jgi:hypothetical protein
MAYEDAWLDVARECPRRIMGELHRCGDYHHGTSSRYPAKVLCCHRDAPLPEGWRPTPAQVQAWQTAGRAEVAAAGAKVAV